MSQASVENIVKVIESLSHEDRGLLEKRLADNAKARVTAISLNSANIVGSVKPNTDHTTYELRDE